jgi:serine/threonine protein kinase
VLPRVWSIDVKGRILAGKYRLESELGRGGMGSVWRAEHIELRSPVAVKLIDPALAETREGQSRFLREARAAGSLRSSHVVSVFDYGVDGATPFLVMELLEGESLATRLERRGKLTLAETQAIVRQVARGLAKAHAASIVHRDLKPENIFITNEGDTELVKVLDFGIAKVGANVAVSVQTQTGMVLGTPFYMSPEQAEGRRELDARSDIWSFGVIVYECLLGSKPFDGDNLAQIILAICVEPLPVPSHFAVVPAGFDEWFARVTERRLERRCPTIQELAESFDRVGDPLLAHGATIPMASPGAALPEEPQPEPAPVSPKRVSHHSATPSQLTTDVQNTSSRALTKRPRWLWAMAAPGLAAIGLAALIWKNASEPQGEGPGDSNGEVTGRTLPPGQVRPAEVETKAPAAPTASEVNGLASGTSSAAASASVTVEEHTLEAPSSATSTGTASITSTDPGGPSVATPVPSVVANRPPVLTSKPPEPTRSAPISSGLYCSQHPISGRIVSSSYGKAGSFPCYVHGASGELRKKE